ncbi:MAG: alpha/beta hydrolase [Corynebacteriales bacterium]|nr:alpha/beta hydrolase [Mycobacteriales bacterium]
MKRPAGLTRPVTWSIAIILVLVVAVVVVLVVGLSTPDGTDNPARGGDTPGSVLSAKPMDDLPLLMKLGKVKGSVVQYVSTDSSGKRTRVSGTVFKPGGEAPAGGWPVVAVAHGTLGINTECGPSLSSDLHGLIGLAQGLLGAKYAVAIADYQGLGEAGVHPYLDSDTAGRNVIDSVRALRSVFDDISPRWGGFGSSQGGGAIWAADEDARTYAPELDLVGVVAGVPAADVVGLVAKARAGTLTRDQAPALQWIVEAAARSHPDIVRDDYRSGSAVTNWDVLSACAGPLVSRRNAAADALGPFDLAPRTDEAAARLTDLLRSYALPRKAISAPMYVLYGDADTYIDKAWTKAAVAKACALGDRLTISEQAGKGHGDIDLDNALPWLQSRFAGATSEQDC